MTTVIHKTPDFIGVPLYTLKRGDCFKLEYNDNHLYMKIGAPDGLIRWAQVYVNSEDAQCALDLDSLDSSDRELNWFKPERMVKPIDVEIKEL